MSSILDRTCCACNETKFIIEFYTNSGLYQSCKDCISKAKTQTNRKTILWSNRARYIRAKASAKQRKKEFALTLAEYGELISKSCYYCNDQLRTDKSRGIGLDRIDNSIGYNKDNVLPCCGFCNEIRSDKLSVEEMKKVAEFIISLKNTNKSI